MQLEKENTIELDNIYLCNCIVWQSFCWASVSTEYNCKPLMQIFDTHSTHTQEYLASATLP